MTIVVLDAPALLALLLAEPGWEKVKSVVDGALFSAVNLGELVSYAKLSELPEPLTLPSGHRHGQRRLTIHDFGAVARRQGVDPKPSLGMTRVTGTSQRFRRLVLGASRTEMATMIAPPPIRVVPVDMALSYEAGMLRPPTLPGGLSRGDRYSLALAKREGVTALTAERRWPAIAAGACVTVDVIR